MSTPKPVPPFNLGSLDELLDERLTPPDDRQAVTLADLVPVVHDGIEMPSGDIGD